MSSAVSRRLCYGTGIAKTHETTIKTTSATATMSDVAISSADECTKAIERALAAMDPPLDVYEGIVKLIAEFVPYGTKIPHTFPVRDGDDVARFDATSSDRFDVTNDGKTATLRSNASDTGSAFIGVSPTCHTGTRPTLHSRKRSRTRSRPKPKLRRKPKPNGFGPSLG